MKRMDGLNDIRSNVQKFVTEKFDYQYKKEMSSLSIGMALVDGNISKAEYDELEQNYGTAAMHDFDRGVFSERIKNDLRMLGYSEDKINELQVKQREQYKERFLSSKDLNGSGEGPEFEKNSDSKFGI